MLRQVFFLTSKSLTAYQYTGGKLEHMAKFVAADAGLAYFDDYLQYLGQAQTTVLTDLTEEDFRIDSVAHTLGADRKALLERHAARIFRGTEYRYAQVLTRDPQNARKDEALFSGLLNPELVDMWLEAMTHNKVPIDGVHSLSLLSAGLLKRLCPKIDDVLFVTDNAESGLRQSFFKGGKLRFSRLTPMPDGMASSEYSNFVHAEIGKTKRYLANLHLLQGNVRLAVCMLSGGERLIELNRMRDTESLSHYNFLDLADVATQFRYKGPPLDAHCDHLFAFLQMKMHVPNHYANSKHRFHFQMFRARQAMSLFGVTAIVGGVLWAGTQAVDIALNRGESANTSLQISNAVARYQEAQARIPQSEVAPDDVRTAVELADKLRRQRRDPHDLLASVGQSLEQQPAMALEKIEWFVASNRNATVSATSETTPDPAGVVPAMSDDSADGTPGQYQIGIVRGRITRFTGDYRNAHHMIEELLISLRKTRGVLVAEAMELPINTAPSGDVEGAVNSDTLPEVYFTVRVVMGEDHEQL